MSPKMMLLKAQHTLKEHVDANDTKKTKKRKDGCGAKSTNWKRLEVESDSDITTESEAQAGKPAPKKMKADRGKSLQPNAPKKKKHAKAKVPREPQARQENESPNQNPKEVVSPNEASDHGAPHANEPPAPKKATFTAEV